MNDERQAQVSSSFAKAMEDKRLRAQGKFFNSQILRYETFALAHNLTHTLFLKRD